MHRNNGKIGPKQNILVTDCNGVFDLWDQYDNDATWPKPPTISSVSFSGDVGGVTNADERVLWGHNTASKFYFNYTGNNLEGYTYDVIFSNNTVPGSNTDNGSWNSTSIIPTNNTTLTYSNGLTIKLFSITGDSLVDVEVKIHGTNTVLFSHTIEIASYTVRASNAGEFNEGDNVYASFYLDGTTAQVANYVDVRFENNWSGAVDFYSDVTPTDYSGYFSNYTNTWNSGLIGVLREDMLTEGTETFTISPRSYGGTLSYSYFTLVSQGKFYNQFEVNDTSRNFTTSISDTTPDEGDTITILCEAEDASSETVRWELYSGTATTADFSPAGGTFQMSSNTNSNGKHYYDLLITISRDFMTEGSETAVLRFYNNDTNAYIHQSATITIGDTTTLGSVSQTATSINEGGAVTFTINVNGAQSGVNYTHYWRTIGLTSASGTSGQPSDFSDGATSGSFTINGSTGSGTVTRTMANDGFTEGTETWKLQVSNTSAGPWVDAGSTVTVNDTSTGSTEPLPGIGGDISNILSAVSSLNWNTNYATIISAINNAGNGYRVIATPRASAMAESMTGVANQAAMSTSGTGHFDLSAFNSSNDYLELTSGFSNNTLNGYPYMGFVMFNSTGPYGVAIMIFRDYTSTTTLLKNLFYPETDRELYTYVLNANNSVVTDTSGNTSTIISDGMDPGTNGYYTTGRFARDDGVWGFVNGTTRLDGNGGPYPSQNSSNAYCPPANQNSGDSVTPHYWGASYNTSTNTDTAPRGGAYFFIKYS